MLRKYPKITKKRFVLYQKEQFLLDFWVFFKVKTEYSLNLWGATSVDHSTSWLDDCLDYQDILWLRGRSSESVCACLARQAGSPRCNDFYPTFMCNLLSQFNQKVYVTGKILFDQVVFPINNDVRPSCRIKVVVFFNYVTLSG